MDNFLPGHAELSNNRVSVMQGSTVPRRKHSKILLLQFAEIKNTASLLVINKSLRQQKGKKRGLQEEVVTILEVGVLESNIFPGNIVQKYCRTARK